MEDSNLDINLWCCIAHMNKISSFESLQKAVSFDWLNVSIWISGTKGGC